MTQISESLETFGDVAGRAKNALERVCSGAGLDPAARYYSPAFRDHVNDLEFRSLEWTQRSIDMYKSVLSEISIEVQEQLVDGEGYAASAQHVRGCSVLSPVRFAPRRCDVPGLLSNLPEPEPDSPEPRSGGAISEFRAPGGASVSVSAPVRSRLSTPTCSP